MTKHIIPRYSHYVVAAYDGPYGDRGTIVSRHMTLAAAQRAVRNAYGWLVIRSYHDITKEIAVVKRIIRVAGGMSVPPNAIKYVTQQAVGWLTRRGYTHRSATNADIADAINDVYPRPPSHGGH